MISVTFWVPFSLGRGLRGYNFGIILGHINNSLIVPAIAKSVKRIAAFVDAMRFCKYSILRLRVFVNQTLSLPNYRI